MRFMERHQEMLQSASGWDIPVFCITGSTTPDVGWIALSLSDEACLMRSFLYRMYHIFKDQ